MRGRIWTGTSLTDDDIRSLWRSGLSLSDIFGVAYRHRRLGRAAVREIVFGR